MMADQSNTFGMTVCMHRESVKEAAKTARKVSRLAVTGWDVVHVQTREEDAAWEANESVPAFTRTRGADSQQRLGHDACLRSAGHALSFEQTRSLFELTVILNCWREWTCPCTVVLTLL
jgi:hypothetical protein